MHSYADQRTHDFFLNRDYPPVENLSKVFAALGDEPQPVEELRAASDLAEEEFDKALEKLEIHGGARVDFGGTVTRGAAGWQKTYTIQAQHRAEQFENVVAFTDSSACRMSQLVRHFGDVKDAGRPCGICDVCDPAGAVLRRFRYATPAEQNIVRAMVDELRPVDYLAAGTLQKKLDLVGRISRDEFEALLDAMVRARTHRDRGIVLREKRRGAAFPQGDAERRRIRLAQAAPLELLIADGIVEEFDAGAAPPRRSKQVSNRTLRKNRSAQVGESAAADARIRTACGAGCASGARPKQSASASPRTWCCTTAHYSGRPGAAGNPTQLLEIDGIGPAKVERFGEAILELCAMSPGDELAVAILT